MITSNVIDRIFRIEYEERTGTCFTITVEDEMYLITARHIVKKIKESDIVQIYRDGEWEERSVRLIGHTSPLVDISVLTGDLCFSGNAPMPASRDRLAYGQDMYFLGFPDSIVNIDQASSLAMKMNKGFPFPIVKHAIFSGIGNDNHFFIDGHGNRGFSGGPVVFRPNGSKYYQVAGVISKYAPEINPVYKIYENELQAKNDGGGTDPIGYFRGNSGITTVSWIKHAIDLIEKLTNEHPKPNPL